MSIREIFIELKLRLTGQRIHMPKDEPFTTEFKIPWRTIYWGQNKDSLVFFLSNLNAITQQKDKKISFS